MKARNGFRKIVLESGIWQFTIGSNAVVIFSPDDRKIVITLVKFTGLSKEIIKEQKIKITPRQVKNYIIENIVKLTAINYG